MLGGPLIDEPLVPESEEEVPDEFKPFTSEGFASLPGDMGGKRPVTIVRDTAASQSVLLRGVLPLTEEMESGNSILIRGVEINCFKEPLFQLVTLESGIPSLWSWSSEEYSRGLDKVLFSL